MAVDDVFRMGAWRRRRVVEDPARYDIGTTISADCALTDGDPLLGAFEVLTEIRGGWPFQKKIWTVIADGELAADADKRGFDVEYTLDQVATGHAGPVVRFVASRRGRPPGEAAHFHVAVSRKPAA